jgi:cytochrome c553
MKTLILALLTIALTWSTTTLAQNITHGKQLAEEKACASCHGEGLNQPVAPNFPKIAGQYQDYVYHALRQYNPKFANNAVIGRNNPVMSAIVGNMSDTDLLDLSAYVASLPGDLRVK